MRLAKIPRHLLSPHPRNVRADLGDLEDLSGSLRKRGQLQPLTVRPLARRADGLTTFRIIDGHRRFAAMADTGITEVVCIVEEKGDESSEVATMLASALHRQLTPLEQARGYQRLVHEGVDVDTISELTGITKNTILGRLALLALPEQVQQMVADREVGLQDAVRMGRDLTQAKAGRQGTGSPTSAPASAAVRATKAQWFGPQHRLAPQVSAACTHGDTRVLVGRVGCGQCWEAAIVADATASGVSSAA